MNAYKYLQKNKDAKKAIETTEDLKKIRDFEYVKISFSFYPPRDYEKETVGYVYEGLRGFTPVKDLKMAAKIGGGARVYLTDESIRKLNKVEMINHDSGWARHPDIPFYFLCKDEIIEAPALLENE